MNQRLLLQDETIIIGWDNAPHHKGREIMETKILGRYVIADTNRE